MFIETIFAGDQGQAAGWDHVDLGVGKPGSGKKRVRLEEPVPEPESAGDEDAGQLSQIIRFVLNSVKTTDVQCQLKWTGYFFHVSCVVGENVGLNAGLSYFPFCNLNGAEGEIKTRHLPACICKRDKVRAGAAADIDGARGGVA